MKKSDIKKAMKKIKSEHSDIKQDIKLIKKVVKKEALKSSKLIKI